jgi:hypothetical protein
MHHGIVAATCSQSDLLGELARHVAVFTVGGYLDGPYDVQPFPPGGSGWMLAIGELDGRSFLLDTSLVLSNSADMLLSMSTRLGTVIGCGSEAATGSAWLTVARQGLLDRFVYVSRLAMREGLSVGEPVSTEHYIPLLEGGLYPAMATLGLDPRTWLAAGPCYELAWDGKQFPTDGRIAALQKDHYERYGL